METRNTATMYATVEGGLSELTDLVRLDAGRALPQGQRAKLGQFMTPAAVAQFMAGLFRPQPASIRLLDAGAGVGSLTAAFTEAVVTSHHCPNRVEVDAWEIDGALTPYLEQTMSRCESYCAARGAGWKSTIHQSDFLRDGAEAIDRGIFAKTAKSYNAAILNPPYHKIRSDSEARLSMRRIGLETTNLYSAFLAVAAELLEPGGEMVAITPRSFCNGPYFRPFRERFLSSMTLLRVHVFDRRDQAFQDDDVLQETVIVHAVKKPSPQGRVVISSSHGPQDLCPVEREVPFEAVVRADDPEKIIHLVSDALGDAVTERMRRFRGTLNDLDVQVSTGRVVDFRSREHLIAAPRAGAAPLIYPQHLHSGRVRWPLSGKKPNAIDVVDATEALLMPAGFYVLVKRFSSKEEARRIVASLYDPADAGPGPVGFENHLNVIHRSGAGLPRRLARGLVLWLNSGLVDAHFRGWSGHTQVNATDLRAMTFPPTALLEALGDAIRSQNPTQDEIDREVEKVLSTVKKTAGMSPDPIAAKKRVDEALVLLKSLGLPREQNNERSALTLLALLDLDPAKGWAEADAPLRGITPMMGFFSDCYGKQYAPNTRETVRRFTVHQFIDAGIVLENPDKPTRPPNSPKSVYQIAPGVLEVARAYGTRHWDRKLEGWLSTVETLKARYAQGREMLLLPVTIAPGTVVNLSPGGQNELVRQIVHEFCPRFTPGGRLLYLGDAAKKWVHFEQAALAELGVTVDEHGKMPDVVVHFTKLNWLVLVEAVTTHGPVNAKRRGELAALFKQSTAGLVYVTAFLDRKAMTRYLGEISWETEVWVADSPSHMIHFNGERFLGPY